MPAWLKRPAPWIVLVALVAAIPIARTLARKSGPKLETFGHAPDFRLTDQDGKPFGSNDLRGKVWVADFIFTRCPSICPAITAQMAQLQRRLGDLPVTLVSFSVDPEHDTPAVLADYAKKAGAQPGRWIFLTGDYDAVVTAVEKGLKQAMEKIGNTTDLANVKHSPYVVLVDGDGAIRGFYNTTDEDAIDRVLNDARWLARH